MDVGGCARRSVGDLQGRAPGEPAVGGAPVPDVPVMGPVGLLEIAVRRLHVPEAVVAPPGSHDARLRRILAVDGDSGCVAPGSALVRGDRHVARLGTAVGERPLVGEHGASVRVGRDRRLSRVELAAPEREAVFPDRHLRDDHVLPGCPVVAGDDGVMPDLTGRDAVGAARARARVSEAALGEGHGSIGKHDSIVGVEVASAVDDPDLLPRGAGVVRDPDPEVAAGGAVPRDVHVLPAR